MKTSLALEPHCEKNSLELKNRIDDFKNDAEQMDILVSFINDIIKNAKLEAEKKCILDKGQQTKTRSNSMVSSLKSGRMANRARGFMVRMYDVICNCANTAAGPVQRIHFSSKKAKK